MSKLPRAAYFPRVFHVLTELSQENNQRKRLPGAHLACIKVGTFLCTYVTADFSLSFFSCEQKQPFVEASVIVAFLFLLNEQRQNEHRVNATVWPVATADRIDNRTVRA